MKKFYRITFLILLIAIQGLTKIFAQWEQTGPYGGVINEIAVKENSNTIFVKDRNFRLARSYDLGQHWEPINSSASFPGNSIVSMGDYIISGTQECAISRSSDDGTTWENANSGYTPGFAPNIFQKCGSHLFAAYNNKLFMSGDTAGTWAGVFTYANSNTNITAAAATDSVFFFGGDDYMHGIFRSLDYGNTWVELTQGLEIPGYPGFYGNFESIVVRHDTVLVSSPLFGVVISKDNGDSFFPVNSGLGGFPSDAKMVFNGDYVYLAVDDKIYRFDFNTNNWTLFLSDNFYTRALYSNNGLLYVATNFGILSIEDSGGTAIINSLNNNDLNFYHGASITKISNNVFTSVYNGASYKTNDNDTNWVTMTTMGNSEILSADSGLFITAPLKNYLRYSHDLGNSWKFLYPQGLNNYIKGVEKIGDTIIIASPNAMYRSTDNGNSFQTINTGLPISSVTNIQGVRYNGKTLYAPVYGEGIYRSTDRGTTWEYSGLKDTIFFNFEFASAGGVDFIGKYNVTPEDGIYRTKNQGVSWEKVLGGSNGNLGIFKMYSAGNKIFAATILNLPNGSKIKKLYMSDDLGDTWNIISDNSFITSGSGSSANDSLVFFPDENRIYVSANFGNSWIDISGNNMPNDIRFSNSLITDNKVYVASNRSIWQRNLSDFKAPELDMILGTEYPCIGSVETYSAPYLPLVNYNWQVPSGWGIVSGQGTNTITVEVGSNTGLILVVPSNDFGTGNSQYLSVMPVSSIPGQPNEIFGNAAPEINSTQTYSVDAITGAMYQWEFPSGWVQISGGNSNQVTVTVGNSSGVITCTPFNGCGVGTAQTLAVTSSVGVNEINEHNILLYPNPVSNILKIKYLSEFKDKINVSITDITGKEVYKNEMISNLLYVNVNNFSKGVYFVHFNNSKLTATQKIVIN